MKALLKLMGLTIIVSLFTISCKKDLTETQEASSNSIEKEANLWFNSVKSSISGTVLQNTLTRIKSVDFGNSFIIKDIKNGVDKYFLKIKENEKAADEYISFERVGSNYFTIGRLKVTESNKETQELNITEFFTKRKLQKNFIISFYSLNNQHQYTYERFLEDNLKQITIKKNHPTNTNTNSSNLIESCIDWYQITTYTYPDGTQTQTEVYITTTCNGGSGCELASPNGNQTECINPGEGGGGGGGSNPEANTNASANICPGSFNFNTFVQPSTMSGGWQVAGTNNIHMNIVDLVTGQVRLLMLPTMYFGMPVIRNGVNISSGDAAAYAAEAVEYAEQQVMTRYHLLGGSLDIVGMTLYYRQKMNDFMSTHFTGSATLIAGSNINVTNFGNAQYGWPIIGCL